MKTYIGLDNGTTGTIAIIPQEGETLYFETPIKNEQDYTKKKKNITRLDFARFKAILEPYKGGEVFLLMERPLVNPQRFIASCGALRCHEAQLIAIEELSIPFQYVDSKEWQKDMLPKGVGDTKKASLDIGNRLFPQFKECKHSDRDALLMAYYAKKHNF